VDIPRDPDLDSQRLAAALWLASHVRKTKGRYPIDSYWIKHAVQRWTRGFIPGGRYVSSLAVVQAAKALGFATVGPPDSAGNRYIAVALKRPRRRRDAPTHRAAADAS
jgi:hypothetical protein